MPVALSGWTTQTCGERDTLPRTCPRSRGQTPSTHPPGGQQPTNQLPAPTDRQTAWAEGRLKQHPKLVPSPWTGCWVVLHHRRSIKINRPSGGLHKSHPLTWELRAHGPGHWGPAWAGGEALSRALGPPGAWGPRHTPDDQALQAPPSLRAPLWDRPGPGASLPCPLAP